MNTSVPRAKSSERERMSGLPMTEPPLDLAIEVSGLTKSYGDTLAVDDVHFSVRRGEIFGIIGPNGAGKTTTVECIQGLRRPTGGHIRLLGVDVAEHPEQLKHRIGSQLQESALPDRMKVWEALDLFSSLAPGGLDWREVMEKWGLTDKAKSSFASLSGGQRQRLFIALALVNDPEVVFLDELTHGLDPIARRVAWELVRTVRDRGATVVLVTHDMDEAEQLCDRVAVIAGGRLIALGTPREIAAGAAAGTRVRFSSAEDVSWLAGVPDVVSVTRTGDDVEVTGHAAVLARTAAALVARDIVPTDLRAQPPSLDDVFLELTGRRS